MILKPLWLLVTLLPMASLAAEPVTGIHVYGTGEVKAVPDMARLTLEVRREGMEPAELKRELDQVTARVLELARDLGIEERDVTAAAVSIYPHYRPKDDDDVPDGVIATRTIEVTVKDLAMLAGLINGALDRGVNGVQGVQLDVSQRKELENEALDLAIDDAVQEARRMAKRFQVELGPLKDATSTSHQVQPMMRMEAAMADRSGGGESFAPGELTIRRDVQATFSIRP